jgi:RimJ/RimL family protein N-acetyltransferase
MEDYKNIKQGIFRKCCVYIKKVCSICLFLLQNIYGSICLRNIAHIGIDGETVVYGASIKDLKEALYIYSFYNNKNKIDISYYILYFFFSKRLVFIAKDIFMNKIIGVELYYFNRSDIEENTIHQGFRGILPVWQGKGMGTSLTNHAINHFKSSRLDGISSRVSLNNLASLRSNMKLGFRPIEEYFDKNMNENRYYLICPFGRHDHWQYLN